MRRLFRQRSGYLSHIKLSKRNFTKKNKLFLRSFNGIFNRTIHSILNIKVVKQKNEPPTSAILGAFDCKNKFNDNFFRRKILALREVTYFTGVNFEYVFYGAFHRNRLTFRQNILNQQKFCTGKVYFCKVFFLRPFK